MSDHGRSSATSASIIGGAVLPPLNASVALPRRRTALRRRRAIQFPATTAGSSATINSIRAVSRSVAAT
jgi:hypothetical protein